MTVIDKQRRPFWKVAVFVLLVLVLLSQGFVFFWNRAAMKKFEARTYERLDPRLNQPNSEMADALRQYVADASAVMDSRALYRRNAIVVFKTVLHRLSVVPPYRVREGSTTAVVRLDTMQMLRSFLNDTRFATKDREAWKLGMSTLGMNLRSSQVTSVPRFTGALPYKSPLSSKAETSPSAPTLRPGDDLGTPYLDHEYIIEPGTEMKVEFSVALKSHLVTGYHRTGANAYEFTLHPSLNYWEQMGAAHELVSTELVEHNRSGGGVTRSPEFYLKMRFRLSMPPEAVLNSGCQSWFIVKDASGRTFEKFSLSFSCNPENGRRYHVRGPGRLPR